MKRNILNVYLESQECVVFSLVSALKNILTIYNLLPIPELY